MARFAYKARQGPQKTVEGVIDAETRSECIAKLAQQGFFPLAIVEEKEGHGTGLLGSFRGRARPRDLEELTRQLANLLESGLTLIRALKVLEGQSHSPRMKRLLKGLASAIEDGATFSEGLARYPGVFSDVFVNMVRSGETGGNLELILHRLADFSEKENDMKDRIRNAMIYPLILIVFGSGVVCFLLVFVVPQITSMFTDLGQALPLPTRILISISGLMTAYGWVVFIGATLVFLFLKRLLNTKEARLVIHRLWLRIPVAGELARKSDLAGLGRTLGTLLGSGVPILSALQVSESTLSNEYARHELKAVHGEVAGGAALAESLGRHPFFPPFVTNLVNVGEEGGQLERSLDRIAAAYEREARRTLEVLTSLLGPAMILLLGSVVGFVVIAMLLPIFELNVFMR
ncbi:MAG: type II secretion system F family protein [Candidatus Omnitrophica bacterium]|nr:type II secretion system F family protein [Candidatus Omnitrophota bacterium]